MSTQNQNSTFSLFLSKKLNYFHFKRTFDSLLFSFCFRVLYTELLHSYKAEVKVTLKTIEQIFIGLLVFACIARQRIGFHTLLFILHSLTVFALEGV